jgi:hypothetical protein
MAMTYADWVNSLKTVSIACITGTLKVLLEQKHLYQSLNVEYSKLLLNPKDDKAVKASFDHIHATMQQSWWPIDPFGSKRYASDRDARSVYFEPPDVNVFCYICDRVEAFNLVSAEECISRDVRFPDLSAKERGVLVQAFVFSFQCQRCKGAPQVFLVRRVGLKLIN